MRFATVVLTLLLSTNAFAQDASQAEKASAEDELLESAEAEFRELVCAKAVDGGDPNQDNAIEFVIQQNYVDDRFDAPVYRWLKDSFESDSDQAPVERALRLLPHSKLSDEVRAKLVFECYLKTDAEYNRLTKARRSTRKLVELRKELVERIESSPKETMKLIKSRLESADTPAIMFSLISSLDRPSEDLLPHVLKAAKSDEPEVSIAAMHCADLLIRQLKSKRNKDSELPKAKNVAVNPRNREYAERIIARYDRNKNGSLTKNEYEKMLFDPKPADANRDGKITIEEYAIYLQTKSKRN